MISKWQRALPPTMRSASSPASCCSGSGGRRIRALRRRSSRLVSTALFALLNVLGTREGAIQQELGLAMGIDPSTMVSLIDQLENAGLAKRRPRPTDRRARGCPLHPRAAGP